MNIEDSSIHAWIAQNSLKTSSGKPFDLRSHLFLFDILADDFPKQVWLKAPQVGGTEAALFKAIYKAKKHNMNVIYVMPSQDDVRGLVKGKLNPLIDNNPVIKSYCQDTDTVDLKRIGDSNFYFKGTMTGRAALSISGDWILCDEEDRADQSVVQQFTSRLEFSKYQWELHFSNPSTVGNGVSNYWEKSDKRHWFITCPHCESKQYLSWPESVDIEREIYVCKKCNGELGDEDRRKGSWHPMKVPYEPEYHGYWISLLMCPWVPAKRVVYLHKNKTEEYFYNFVLGLPYTASDAKVTEETILQNLTTRVNTQTGPIVIGVDPGLPIWVTCLSREGLFHWFTTNDYGDIERLLKRWPQAIVVFDQGGDLNPQRTLQEKYPGRVFLCWLGSDRKSLDLIDWGKGDEYGAVWVDRSRMIQLIIDEFKHKRVPINGTREDWWELWTHFANLTRVTKLNANDVKVHKWESRKPDHLVFAYLYARVGMDKFTGGDAGFAMPGSPGNSFPLAVETRPDGFMEMAQLIAEEYGDD